MIFVFQDLLHWCLETLLSGSFTCPTFASVNMIQQMNTFSIYSFFRMNGALIFFLCVFLLYSIYFLALAIAWYKSRQNRIQRGSDGLPDIDSHQAPRSYLRIFGDLCYTALLFLCRLFPQN